MGHPCAEANQALIIRVQLPQVWTVCPAACR